MRVREDESWLDDVLIAAFGSPPQPGLDPWPPRPDFDAWLRQHPEAVAALRSPVRQPRYREAGRRVAARVGWWLSGSRYRAAATTAALGILVALGAWLIGRESPRANVTEGQASREMPGPDPEPPAGPDQRACLLAAKAKEEYGYSGSKAGVVRIKSPHASGPPDRRASAQALKTDGVELFPSAQIDTTSLLAAERTGSGAAGRVPLSIWLAEASAAVRARMVRITEEAVVCEVVRVIYGRVPGKTVHSAGLPWTPLSRKFSGHEPGREPAPAEIRSAVSETYKFKAGREVILTLGSCRKTDEGVVAPFLRVFHDAPGWRSLDELEKQMVDLLAAGAHMMPRCIPEAMGFYIPSCGRIVRGRLAKVDDRTAEWEVVSVISQGPHVPEGFVAPPPKTPDPRYVGPPASEAPAKQAPKTIERSTGPFSVAESKRLIIGLDPWRLRAEAVAAYRAARDSKQPAAEEAVRKEFARLIQAELPVGREAILLVRTVQAPPDGRQRYKLVAILLANAEEGRPIDRLEEAVREMLATGEYLHQNM